MEIYKIRDNLFQSGGLADTSWKEQGISVIFDLEGGLDATIPESPESIFYVYWPIVDGPLPNLDSLRFLAKFGAELVKSGRTILSHCAAGINRSSLLNGSILISLGLSGQEAVSLIRQQRPGALSNPIFAQYLESL